MRIRFFHIFYTFFSSVDIILHFVTRFTMNSFIFKVFSSFFIRFFNYVQCIPPLINCIYVVTLSLHTLISINKLIIFLQELFTFLIYLIYTICNFNNR